MVNVSILFTITVIVSAISSFAIPINKFEAPIAKQNGDRDVRAWTPGTKAMQEKMWPLPGTDLYSREPDFEEHLLIVERNDLPTSESYAAREESVELEMRSIGSFFKNIGSKIKSGVSSLGQKIKSGASAAGNWVKNNWQTVAQVGGTVAMAAL